MTSTDPNSTNGKDEPNPLTDGQYQIGGRLTVITDGGTELKISSKKRLQIIVQNQQGVSSDLNQKANVEQGGENQNKQDKGAEKQGVSSDHKQQPNVERGGENQKNQDKGAEKQGGSDQEEQGTRTILLRNAINKLKNYKGIVITALISFSLGYLLRRKFKGSVAH